MRVLLFFLLCFIGSSALAQKHLKKIVLESDISLVQIDAGNCYEICLETADTHEITVDAQIEGEYSNDLELEIYEVGNTLMITTGFRSSYVSPNDKLSAHKVVSIALKVQVPKWKNVQVYGTNSRVAVTGQYANLDVTLADGACELVQVSQNVHVRTQSGAILIHANSGDFDIFSKYGTVKRDSIPKGNDQYKVTSVTGAIQLRKTE